jgi:hypothetical protein
LFFEAELEEADDDDACDREEDEGDPLGACVEEAFEINRVEVAAMAGFFGGLSRSGVCCN